MPFERFEFLALQVPQLDGLVSTGTGQRLAIWAETDAIDRITVLFQTVVLFDFGHCLL